MSSGITNFWRNLLLDFALRDQAYTPPASVFITLVTTTPTAAAAGTPMAWTGYARQEIPSDLTDWSNTNAAGTTVISTGTSGTISNNNDCDFGTAAGSGGGTATHWEAWDAASSGNRLFWGEITDAAGVPTPRTIAIGDPVMFPAGALQVTLA